MSTVLSVFSFTGYNQGNADDDNDMLLLMLFLMLLLSPLRPFLHLLIDADSNGILC